MAPEQPRRGELIVNWHTGRTKPDDEPFDPNRHGHRCYHGNDVTDAINHWGTLNGRDRDKSATLDVVKAMALLVGPVFETFHIEMYVAVLFADHPDTIGAFLHTGFIDTTAQAVDHQYSINRGYWRYEFADFAGQGSTSKSQQSAVAHADCHCSPGLMAPVGSECPYCGSIIVA